jgi:signal peptidase II
MSSHDVGAPAGLPWHQRGLFWSWLSVLVILLDQITKHAVVWTFAEREVLPISPFFNLTLVYNPGAAWSFLADAGGWQRWFFVGVAVVASVVLIGWLRSLRRTERCISVALALILGGALGNLYDRIVLGKVVDFLDFYWGSAHFPAFNVADSAITVGAAMMIIDMFLPRSAPASTPDS